MQLWQKNLGTIMIIRGFFSALMALAVLVQPTSADETCMSPYMAKIVGQEDYVYIWTLGLEGVGDGEDDLVTGDVNPDSETDAQVIHSISMGGRHEAHHSGLTDDRRYLWASGLDTSKIFIFEASAGLDDANGRLFGDCRQRRVVHGPRPRRRVIGNRHRVLRRHRVSCSRDRHQHGRRHLRRGRRRQQQRRDASHVDVVDRGLELAAQPDERELLAHIVLLEQRAELGGAAARREELGEGGGRAES